MLYIFYGKDILRKKRALDKLLKNLENKNQGLEKIEVDLKEEKEAYKKVIEFVSQQSIFGGGKIAFVLNVFSTTEKEWINFLKQNISSPHFIILSSDEKPSKDFSFLSHKDAQIEEFNELEGEKLKEFVEEEAKENGIKLSSDALDFFVSYLSSLEEGRSWEAFTELKKASFLGRKNITKSDLEGIALFPQFDKVWVLTREILRSKELSKKLASLEKLMLSGEDYFYIFNSLAFNAYGENIQKLADLDLAIKSGKMDVKEALLFFTLSS